jgi:hypothetical protein
MNDKKGNVIKCKCGTAIRIPVNWDVDYYGSTCSSFSRFVECENCGEVNKIIMRLDVYSYTVEDEQENEVEYLI